MLRQRDAERGWPGTGAPGGQCREPGICQYWRMADQARLPDLDERPAVLSVSDVHRRVRGALERFGALWVEGEVSDVAVRNGHRYLTLIERGGGFRGADCQLRAVCWSSTWARIAAKLARLGLEINPGTVVQLRGKLAAWDRSETVLVAEQVNTDALVGRAALAKRRLLESLAQEGLFRRNAEVPLGPVPLRLGLLAAPGTEGLADFRGVLERSGFGFEVLHVGVAVQGAAAAREIAAAIGRLEGSVELIAIVRGGGSRGDLAAFDDEVLARAICACPVPVWCGVGHTGDRSVADEVAHRSHPTPTACAEALRQMVLDYGDGVERRLRTIHHRAEAAVRDATRALVLAGRALQDGSDKMLERRSGQLAEMARRIELGACRCESDASARVSDRAVLLRAHALHKLDALGRDLAERSRNVGGAAGRRLAAAEGGLSRPRSRLTYDVGMAEVTRQRLGVGQSAERVSSRVVARLEREGSAVAATRKLLNAYDPLRQLERGWTLTTTVEGRVVRSAEQMEAGRTMVTRFADGELMSVVSGKSPGERTGAGSGPARRDGETESD